MGGLWSMMPACRMGIISRRSARPCSRAGSAARGSAPGCGSTFHREMAYSGRYATETLCSADAGGFGSLAGGQRQADHELAPLVRTSAVGLHRAAVQFHDPPNDAQSDPQTARRARDGVVELSEEVENQQQLLGGDAHAIVAHPDYHFVAFRVECGAERDAPAARRVLG